MSCEQGINGGSVTIDYDKEKLELLENEIKIDSNFINIGSGLKFDFLCNSRETIKKANVLILPFKVKDNLDNIETSIKTTNVIIDSDIQESTQEELQVQGISIKINKKIEEQKQTILYPKTISLSKTSFIYNKKVQKPKIIAKDSEGKTISSSNYSLTYSNKNSKNVGKYTINIKFKGIYSGTKTLTYKIKPKGVTIKKLTSGKKQIKLGWNKNTTQTTGYEIQYSTDKNFKSGNKKVTIKKNKTTSSTVKKLKGNRKYFVRIRTYRTVKENGKNVNIYSGWSKVKNVKTKK